MFDELYRLSMQRRVIQSEIELVSFMERLSSGYSPMIYATSQKDLPATPPGSKLPTSSYPFSDRRCPLIQKLFCAGRCRCYCIPLEFLCLVTVGIVTSTPDGIPNRALQLAAT
jgi:hypothetical protein